MAARQQNNIPDQTQQIAEQKLIQANEEIKKINRINCKQFSINYDMNKAPYYVQTVEFNTEFSTAKQKVYDALITFIFDKVMNIHETIYKEARYKCKGDPRKNKNVLNMYKAVLGKLVQKDKQDSVKEYKCIKFIDHLVSGYGTNSTYKRALKSINGQVCINVDYDLVFEHLSTEFQEEYIKSSDLIEKEVNEYLETAYYAALKIININNKTIKNVIR